jgi:septal ring factor EnvC (AmiA/AmiB activator)
MPLRLGIQIAAVILAVVLGVAIVDAWRADRRDRAQLASELAATKKTLADADARQRERDSQLAETLSGLATLKRTIVTPSQIVREIPREIPLPSPITLQSATPTNFPAPQAPAGSNSNSQTINAPEAKLPQALIPTEDLKPLYDFALDCKACQARLAAAQNDLTDERAKTAALTRERDDALRIARGGTVWRRVARAAKWFAIGAAAGAIAAHASH